MLDNGGIGVRQIKIGSGVDRRDRSVIGLSSQLVVDRNEKIIGNIGRIALKFGKAWGDNGGQNGDE